MTESRRTNAHILSENRRLRAAVAQLEDRLDHLAEHGTAAQALRESEALHREVMSVVSDVVLIADDTGRLVYVSPNSHYVFGHSAEHILAQGRISFLLPPDLFDPDLLRQRTEITNIDCTIRDALGRARNLLVTVRRIERHGGTVLYACRDVTERLAIETDKKLMAITLEREVEERTQQLRESGERYRRLVEGVRDQYLFYATDPQGIVTYVSPSVYTILGRTPDQTIGHNWREFVDTNHELYPELERLEKMRFAGITTPPFCAPVLHADGSVRIMEFRDASLCDADGRVTASEGIGKDITDRIRSEEDLRKARDEFERGVQIRTAELTAAYSKLQDSEDRYRSVVNDQLDFIVRWRPDGTCTFVNKSYCEFVDATEDELKGTDFLSKIVEDDRDPTKRKLSSVSADDPVVAHDLRMTAANGHVASVHWTHRALFDGEGRLVEFQSVGSDVTERRRRDKQTQELAIAVVQLRALSDREHGVMRLVVEGDANKVIARKLGLSVKTIEKHRSNLMKKLHVRSVPELVRLAMLVEKSNDF
jgi:PAS domain S-box-containing protein